MNIFIILMKVYSFTQLEFKFSMLVQASEMQVYFLFLSERSQASTKLIFNFQFQNKLSHKPMN